MSGGDFSLPPPGRDSVDVLFVAGEHSGDQHAALIARDLQSLRPDWFMAAIGGPSLDRQGVQLLHDLTKTSVVGFIEVVRHYSEFRKLFNVLIEWIRKHQPSVVVLVDYPGFNLRLAEALCSSGISRKGGGPVAVYQYVSPQIWAWKGKRRFKMADVLDELGVIFPFELDCYADTDLPVSFVGHPFARPGYENPVWYEKDGPLLLLPGSRLQAVSRIFPVMVATAQTYRESGGKRPFVCLYPEEGVREILNTVLQRRKVEPDLISLRAVEEGTAAAAVLTSSGTMSLNCALAGIPGAIVYRAHPLTAFLGRRLIRVDWLGIANLVLGRSLYPEFIQKEARPGRLARLLAGYLGHEEAREPFEKGAGELLQALRSDTSETVAERLERLLESD